MKKIKVSIFAVIAIVMGIAASAFTPKEVLNKSDNLFYYRYASSQTDQTNIQTISNYERSSLSCSGTNHVCGVLLPTDKSLGQQPDASEFNAEKGDLWTSEQAGTSVDPDIIKMKN